MAVKHLVFLAVLISTAVNADVLESSDYVLSYDPGWVVDDIVDPPGYRFTSDDREVSLTLSSLRFANDKDARKIAEAWLQLRMKSEIDVTGEMGRQVEIQSNFREIPAGYQAEYWGSDSAERNFRFWSVVVGDRIVNFYIESYARDAAELEAILRKLLKGLRI